MAARVFRPPFAFRREPAQQNGFTYRTIRFGMGSSKEHKIGRII
jgi:hypothetical protein